MSRLLEMVGCSEEQTHTAPGHRKDAVTARNSRAASGGCPSYHPTGMSFGLCSLPSPLRISKSSHVIPLHPAPLSWVARNHNVDHRASSKLFSDAEHEERAGATPTRAAVLPGTTPEQPNWTGDERIEDTVLRMLVDKYKPLRTGTIQSAEEKMHRAPP